MINIGYMRNTNILGLFLVFILTSCVHVISEESLQAARKEVGFSQIMQDTDKYMNDLFVLGGTIVEVRDTRDGSELEVIQNPTDKYGTITDKDISDGRYIIITSKHLDPIIYKKGRLVTVAGKLVQSRKKQVEEISYLYPVFEAKELYLWKKEKYYPYPSPLDPFYYYPYSYYWYDPYWHRPYFYP